MSRYRVTMFAAAVLLAGVTGVSLASPPNDNFGNAYRTLASPSSNTQDTTGATVESGEPLPCGQIGATVWYRFESPIDQDIFAETTGSNFDTVLAVHAGDSLGSLSLIACNDDAYYSARSSAVSFRANARTLYHVQAGGYRGATGALQLNLDGVVTLEHREQLPQDAGEGFARATSSDKYRGTRASVPGSHSGSDRYADGYYDHFGAWANSEPTGGIWFGRTVWGDDWSGTWLSTSAGLGATATEDSYWGFRSRSIEVWSPAGSAYAYRTELGQLSASSLSFYGVPGHASARESSFNSRSVAASADTAAATAAIRHDLYLPGNDSRLSGSGRTEAAVLSIAHSRSGNQNALQGQFDSAAGVGTFSALDDGANTNGSTSSSTAAGSLAINADHAAAGGGTARVCNVGVAGTRCALVPIP